MKVAPSWAIGKPWEPAATADLGLVGETWRKALIGGTTMKNPREAWKIAFVHRRSGC
jgi:hypothetical protein